MIEKNALNEFPKMPCINTSLPSLTDSTSNDFGFMLAQKSAATSSHDQNMPWGAYKLFHPNKSTQMEEDLKKLKSTSITRKDNLTWTFDEKAIFNVPAHYQQKATKLAALTDTTSTTMLSEGKDFLQKISTEATNHAKKFADFLDQLEESRDGFNITKLPEHQDIGILTSMQKREKYVSKLGTYQTETQPIVSSTHKLVGNRKDAKYIEDRVLSALEYSFRQKHGNPPLEGDEERDIPAVFNIKINSIANEAVKFEKLIQTLFDFINERLLAAPENPTSQVRQELTKLKNTLLESGLQEYTSPYWDKKQEIKDKAEDLFVLAQHFKVDPQALINMIDDMIEQKVYQDETDFSENIQQKIENFLQEHLPSLQSEGDQIMLKGFLRGIVDRIDYELPRLFRGLYTEQSEVQPEVSKQIQNNT
jgi:hypothetical protein